MALASQLARFARGAAKRINPIRYLPASWHARHVDDVIARFASLDLTRSITMVLGSAPDSVRPALIDSRWKIVTANAAQKRLLDWGLPDPDLTVIRANASAPGALQDEMWSQLAGLRTKRMFSAGRIPFASRIDEVGKLRSYEIQETILADWHERLIIIYRITGIWMLNRNPEDTPTNGVLAILVALLLGSPAVVISGISFSKGGYFYGRAGEIQRERADADREAIAALVRRKAPLYATDEAFATESGIPLWDEALARRTLTQLA